MSTLKGKDLVDLMLEGINTHVKDHIREQLIEQEVANFKKRITTEIDNLLSEMVFYGDSSRTAGMFDEQHIRLLIEWSKGQAEYKTKYTMVSEVESS